MAVPAGFEYIDKGYDIPKLNKHLDWFNLLSYDYHSAYEPAANHHAPLYPIEEENEYSFDNDLNIVSLNCKKKDSMNYLISLKITNLECNNHLLPQKWR